MAWLRSKFTQQQQTGRELEDELRSHIELRADDLERSGMGRAEAERQARVEFGGYERLKEECHEAAGGNFGETLVQDIRFGLRMMRRKPGFTVVAVLTLAFAIGANAVAFSVFNGFVLRPINLPHPRDLYMVEKGTNHFEQSYPDYLDIRDRSRTFDGVMAFDLASVGLDSGQGSARSVGMEVTGNYFDVAGVQPYLGRFFHAADERGPDSAPMLVLSYAYWQTHFQGDRGVIGRTVQVNKYPFTIIGIASPRFVGTALFAAPEFWAPMVNQAQLEGESHLTSRTDHEHWIIGRVKPGVSRAQLQGDLDSIAAELIKRYPKEDDAISFHLARPELMGDYVGAAARAFVTGLMLLAGLILLAACANLGSLFSARAADRSREVALRLALGSSRKRVMRQLLTEAILIALAGGVAGVAGSVPLLQWLSTWQPVPDFPITIPIAPDAAVYVFAVAIAMISGLLFGMVPLRQVMASNPYQVIKANHAGIGRRFTLRDVLLTVQIAICAVLVTSSLVAVRGLVRSLHSTFGFQLENALVVNTDLAMARYSAEQQPAMQRRMLDVVAAIPGVTAAAYADSIPLNMDTNFSHVFADSTTDLKASNAVTQTTQYGISTDYFRAAGTTLLAGRVFTPHDDKASTPVAVVNQIFARKMFGSIEKAIGGHYKTSKGTRVEVVGVAEDGKYINLTEDPQAVMFLPILQTPSSTTWLLVRSRRDQQQMTAAIRAALHGVDPGLPISIKTWTRTMSSSFFPGRIATMSLGVLGGLGALLSVTGIFGMAAYSVSKRLREFGIRIALGAQRKEVLRAALGRTFTLLACGSVAGLLLGLAAGKVLAVIVFLATPWDPVVLGGVLLTMLCLGLVAGWIPAQRALGIDPLILLREE